jgi:hypothetical protein
MTGDGRELDILYSVWIADGHLLLYATRRAHGAFFEQ